MRNTTKLPCQFCEKPIDSRGWRVHTLTCKDRPAGEDVSLIGHVESDRKQGNLRVMLDIYREGFRDGIQLKKVA